LSRPEIGFVWRERIGWEGWNDRILDYWDIRRRRKLGSFCAIHPLPGSLGWELSTVHWELPPQLASFGAEGQGPGVACRGTDRIWESWTFDYCEIKHKNQVVGRNPLACKGATSFSPDKNLLIAAGDRAGLARDAWIGTGRGRHRDRPLEQDAPQRPFVLQKSKREKKFCPRERPSRRTAEPAGHLYPKPAPSRDVHGVKSVPGTNLLVPLIRARIPADFVRVRLWSWRS